MNVMEAAMVVGNKYGYLTNSVISEKMVGHFSAGLSTGGMQEKVREDLRVHTSRLTRTANNGARDTTKSPTESDRC